MQAALGAEVEVPTLDGTAKLTIPAGTQHGAVFRLRGKGVPVLRSNRRGDQVGHRAGGGAGEAQRRSSASCCEELGESLGLESLGKDNRSLFEKILDAVGNALGDCETMRIDGQDLASSHLSRIDMDWIEISVQADGEAAEAVSELFNRLNSRPDGQGGAVTEVSGFDPVGEDHHPIVTVKTYLPADEPTPSSASGRSRRGCGTWGASTRWASRRCARWPRRTGRTPGRPAITRSASVGASWSSRPG